MKQQLEKVKEFQQKFNQVVSETPVMLNNKNGLLRFELMKEENQEYLDAIEKNDLIEVADALGDQLYILLGTINAHGMHNIIYKVFYEIHHSNMSKLGENGKPIFREDGKVLKGPNYFRPNIKQFFP